MKLATLLAGLLCATAPLLALNYTVSIQVDPAMLTQAQGATQVPFHAELRVADKTLSTAETLTLDISSKDLVPATVIFKDVHQLLAKELTQDPEARVEVVYFYKPSATGDAVELARQTVPAVAYAAVADSVEASTGDFKVHNTLKAKTIALDAGGKSFLTLSESTGHQVKTITCETLTIETLYVQKDLKVTGKATLSGPTSFKDSLSGIGLPPVGTIILMEGTPDSNHWQLCDGSEIEDAASPLHGKTTPDMRNRFLRATTDVTQVGKTGGAEQVKLEGRNIPAHKHPYDTKNPAYRHVGFDWISESDTGGTDWINHEEDDPDTQRSDMIGTSNAPQAGNPIPLTPPYCTFNFYLRIK